MDLDRVRAYVRLHLADGVGAVLFKRLVEAFGSPSVVREAGPGAWRGVEGIGPKTAAAIAAVTEQEVEEELALAKEHAVEVLCLEDESYPAALKTIYDPPALLYVRGRLEKADALAVAIVGARRCTHYGMEQAQRLGGLLGQAGFTVVSGGARGIDASAHRGALEAGGRTIAVMGCGLCSLYPPENRKLFQQVVQEGRGAVISELPMRTAVLAGNFPTRNRIISGLSLGVLVIEAARRSGSLITARLAIEQGKDVLAVPGRVDSPFSEGVNQLIRDHSAHLVQNLEDILESLERVGEALKKAGAVEATRPVRPSPALSELEQALLAELGKNEMVLDELVRRSGRPSGQVTGAMTTLAIKGLVAQRPGGIFAVKRAPV